MNEVKELIYKMLTENTGEHMLDSGGAYGRHWQRNQKKSFADFENEPAVDYEVWNDQLSFTVSLFHYLPTVLELDELCNEFNSKKVKDWDSDIYGVSKAGKNWLLKKGFTVGNSWNSYNGEQNLSQTLQGTELKIDGLGEGDYVLLQIHNGCDVRGGYTDAKLFKYQEFQEFINPTPAVFGTINGIEVDNSYNSYALLDENENEIKLGKDPKIELALAE
jgi:hypothetical protein